MPNHQQVCHKEVRQNQKPFSVLVRGKLFTNIYVINECFVEIMVLNGSFSNDM